MFLVVYFYFSFNKIYFHISTYDLINIMIFFKEKFIFKLKQKKIVSNKN